MTKRGFLLLTNHRGCQHAGTSDFYRLRLCRLPVEKPSQQRRDAPSEMGAGTKWMATRVISLSVTAIYLSVCADLSAEL